MNPRSLLAHHLPTLTEVVDEASIAERGIGLPAASPAATPVAPVLDLSDSPPALLQTPISQEADSLRDDDTFFEATILDHDIRRGLAEAEARSGSYQADPLDLSLGDEILLEPVPVPAPTPAQVPVPLPLPMPMIQASSPVDDAQLSERVLLQVQRQVDALLEHRLREALAPLLAHVADTLAVQAREMLASSLRDLVSQAVAHEIERQRGR